MDEAEGMSLPTINLSQATFHCKEECMRPCAAIPAAPAMSEMGRVLLPAAGLRCEPNL